ncbi:Hint domain-containing protein [Pseudoalteromonas sp. DL2-H2.2]|uniref:Hint domain-containing protein n=1 Tax=Pseudoalteromonas sp. DL2-H2.2 TaxID=2908889 RepID=UPI001F17D233|nr:Hint domain-containing protein [Pseudoalteromonas sp. DL2-H2.2]MCF2910663.1 Hint domain-containing protein [Pseudoalteromonas sp. DL2-H2.2]
MKPLYLSIALALGTVSVMPDTFAGSLKATSGVAYQQDMQIKNERLKARLAQHGLSSKNRPQLFSLIEQRLEQDMLVTENPRPSSLQNCLSGRPELCSFFKHMGIEVAKSNANGESYVVLSALNSKTVSTDYTLIDLHLTNEKGEQLTKLAYNEYFGDGQEAKRKSVYSFAKVQDILPKLAASERIFADGWVTSVYKGADNKQIVEDRNIVVEYSKDTLLAKLGYFAQPRSGASDTEGVSLLPLAGRDGFKTDIKKPIDNRSEGGADVPDGKIIICLNRNYGDCDYENIYPIGTPTSETKLKVPFQGSFNVMGKVTRIYLPDFTTLEVQEENGVITLVESPVTNKPAFMNHGTNIFIQTKEGGGAVAIGDFDYQDISDLFARKLNLRYDKWKGMDRTIISWNIPQYEGVFGDATLFGRYQDTHWIMHFALDHVMRPGRPPRTASFVIGSTDMDSGWGETDRPQMQIVYSCLAEGSLITLPNGKHLPIEQLEVGDQVLGASEFTPANHLALTIEDISVGVETIPMVQLKTKSGKTLLLTESHPVVMQSGNAVWASKVEQGAQILTENGLEMITHIEEVEFTDKVYNLRLGRSKDDPDYQPGESFSMFANGLQVGDLAMQSEHEFSNKVETTEDVLNRLPQAWHQDYLNSLKQ